MFYISQSQPSESPTEKRANRKQKPVPRNQRTSLPVHESNVTLIINYTGRTGGLWAYSGDGRGTKLIIIINTIHLKFNNYN